MPVFFSLPKNKTRLDSFNLEIIKSGIKAVSPEILIRENLRITPEELSLGANIFSTRKKRLFVIGMGKSAAEMAFQLEKKLGPKITAGLIIGTSNQRRLKKIKFLKGTHPFPSSRNVLATKKILALKRKHNLGSADLVICLISGGGSALFCLPALGVSLKQKQETTRLLLKSKATIHEVNCVRKHLSQVKGGFLARHFEKSTLISLIISDVIGHNLDVIASGPTYFDSTTFAQAKNILKKYHLWNKIPKTVKKYIQDGIKGVNPETPKKLVPRTHNFIIGVNQKSLEAMRQKAQKLGFKARIIFHSLENEVSKAARLIFKKITAELKNNRPSRPLAFIYGGETTVNVGQKKGRGGRNQELTLQILKLISKTASAWPKKNNWSFISCGTDGIDYISQASGGIINQRSIKEITQKKLKLNQYLKNHDSFNLLTQIHGIVSIKGPTNANVGDIGCFLIESSVDN
ncbi:MAG: DUF4147 domain-containing protein [Patescibacteria group bacterium]|nr:DUF4147 domain-containing protein [Patescibacteria group bacterium]